MWRMAWVWLLLGLGVVAARPSAAAGGDARIAAPRVRIEPVATFDSLGLTLDEPGSWSPRGTRLALRRDTNQVWVFDAARPATPPRLVHDAGQRIRFSGWSPDGGWLVLLLGDSDPRTVNTLVAVPLEGGRPDTLRTEANIWFAFWGPDGSIYYRVPHAWPDVPPPHRWRPHASFVARPPLALDLGPGLNLWFGRVHPRRFHELVCFLTFRQDGLSLRVIDALPDGSRFLVSISEATSAAVRLVDGKGGTLLDLREAGIQFRPSSISGDGRWIVGSAAEAVPEVDLPETRLEAADAEGRWVSRIEGGEACTDPQLSRSGSFIAYRTLLGTRVGRLIVERR